jgi:hypothetical protein
LIIKRLQAALGERLAEDLPMEEPEQEEVE